VDETARTEEVVLSADEEALGSDEALGRMSRVVVEELGEERAQRIGGMWQRLHDWDRSAHATEGLRERKKRQTRERISDVATAMFLARGFDNVKISEIAERVGVSEKTIYNYYPTKESLVFDIADGELLQFTTAVRDRPAGSSPTSAFVEALKAEFGRNDSLDDKIEDTPLELLTAFAEMLRSTPALRAAWNEHRHHIVQALTTILADEAGVDRRDPEPVCVARALVSLLELAYDSRWRHISDGLSADRIYAAVEIDIDRGTRLLDTGLWSFNLTVEGRKTKDQLRDAAATAEQTRRQVLKTMRDAKAARRQNLS
jgi:AcrR family transcriptional regulator